MVVYETTATGSSSRTTETTTTTTTGVVLVVVSSGVFLCATHWVHWYYYGYDGLCRRHRRAQTMKDTAVPPINNKNSNSNDPSKATATEEPIDAKFFCQDDDKKQKEDEQPHQQQHQQLLLDQQQQQTAPTNTATIIAEWTKRRDEERAGRIRAEIKLRTVLKNLQHLKSSILMGGNGSGNSNSGIGDNDDNDSLCEMPSLSLSSQATAIETASANDDAMNEGRNGEDDTNHDNTTNTNSKNAARKKKQQPPQTMTMRCIGTVTSPFGKRMGTPRQPALVPSSRGFVTVTVPPETLDGIQAYSHVWILFEFHANTNNLLAVVQDDSCSSANKNANTNNRNQKTKIRPPRAGGIKLGTLATRSPHRPNPLGLSLVRLERWDKATRRLHIAGLDLVHGTPVYDIKPVIPWDIPGHRFSSGGGTAADALRRPQTEADLEQSLDSSTTGATSAAAASLSSSASILKVPVWVTAADDEIATVSFHETARSQLQVCVEQNCLAPLYTTENDGLVAAQETIEQIIAQDPRSSHKGLKIHQRGSVGVGAAGVTAAASSTTSTESLDESHCCYNILFCATQVSFVVTDAGATVVTVIPMQFDDSQYVDGVPIMMTLQEEEDEE